MKIIIFYIVFSILILNCSRNNYTNSIIGNWFTVNKDSAFYEEIYIKDSTFIYCNNIVMGIIHYTYEIVEDTIYLYHSKDNIISKYKIMFDKENKNIIIFENKEEKYLFTRLDRYLNLDSIFLIEEKMDTFLFEFYKRTQKML